MPKTYRPYAESWNPKKRTRGVYNPGPYAAVVPVGAPDRATNPGAGNTTVTTQQRQQNPYADLINNMLNQQRADIGAEGMADRASRDAAIRRILISYGETPELDALGISGEAKGVLGGVMDERTRALAAQNTAEGTSIKARLGQAFDVAQRRVGQQGAAAGRLRSGDTGYQLGQVGLQDKQQRFDTLNEALGNIEGSVGSYAAAERMRQRQLAEYEMNAAWQLSQIWNDSNLGGTEPGGSDLSSQYPAGGPQPGQGPYGGVTDPYWQNLIDYYESAAGTVDIYGNPIKKKQPARGTRDTGTRGGGV